MAYPAIYLDHNATTPVLPEAKAAVMSALDLIGNPVAVHGHGRHVRALVEAARDKVAAAVGAKRGEVTFTGSATEAVAQAIVGGVRAFDVDEIVVGAAEHKSVLAAAEWTGLPLTRAGVDGAGRILTREVAAAAERLTGQGKRGLFALQMVNNETGVVQPLEDIESLIGPTPHLLVADAVQGFGKLDIDFSARATDMMPLAAHKIGGPAGVGALLTKPHCQAVKLIPGDGHEMGRRGGTEPWPLIAGFGAAVEAAARTYDKALIADLLGRMEAGILDRAPDAVFFGAEAERIGNVSFFAVPGLANSVALMGLDLEGVSVSTGSACASGKVAPSHVLEAMGVPRDLALGALRVSLGWTSTASDVTGFLAAFEKVLARQRQQAVRAG